MINKISAIAATALIVGFGSFASAATAHKVVRHHYQAPRGGVTLLENVPVRVNFQSNWNVSY